MIRFRAVSLRAATEQGTVGYDLNFGESRLVAIHGENSVGKSLLVQSLVYGLGLEGAFGPGRQHGLLTRAMTDEVDLDGVPTRVQQSAVTIELENSEGEILTIDRPVVPSTPNGDRLITVRRGAGITEDVAENPEAYYVRQRGAAQNERGFHRFLCDFLQWDPPDVATFEGGVVPLYLELLAPFFVVEQKSGWAGVVPRVPTYLRIREPFEQAVNFLLGASDGRQTRELEAATASEAALAAEYTERRAALQAVASLNGADVVGLPSLMRVGVGDPPEVDLQVRVLRDGVWVGLDDEITLLETALSESSRQVPEPRGAPEGTSERLAGATSELAELGAQVAALEDTADMVDAQLGSLRTRIEHVEEERRRYQEMKTLVDLGSSVIAATIARPDCPTCRQSLIGVEQLQGEVLDYDASIRVLGEHLATLGALQHEASAAADQHASLRRALDERTGELRAEIRALKADLIAPADSVSVAAIQARLTAEGRRNALAGLRDAAVVALDDLRRVVSAWDEAARLRRSFAPAAWPADATGRLERWNQVFRERLHEFGFSTLGIAEVEIGQSGRPTHQGYDIAFQGSASDGVRLRWAYLVSMLEVMTETGGRHIGFLVLDEPRQQEVTIGDYARLLRRLAALPQGQVIITSGEPAAAIAEWVTALDAGLVGIDSALLRRVSPVH